MVSQCRSLAEQLEAQPTDHRLELAYRKAVDAYVQVQQRGAAEGGLAAEDLYDASEADAAHCTVDVDLRFLGKAALAVQASRLHATVEQSAAASGGERAALMQAIMRARTANTGYMASAPPTQALEHFFDLTKRSALQSRASISGRPVRRMVWVDHAQQELALIYKEEETKTYAFSQLTSVEPIESGARLSIGSGRSAEVIVLSSSSAEDASRLRALLEAVAGAGAASAPSAPPIPSPPPPPPPPPSGRVRSWLMSGTVEKEGKMRWAARWLVLTRERLYVLRDVVALCPLNVIPLDARVRVSQGVGARVFTLVTQARSFNFRTSDEKLTERWVSTIAEHCEATRAQSAQQGRGKGAGAAARPGPADEALAADAQHKLTLDAAAFETEDDDDADDAADDAGGGGGGGSGPASAGATSPALPPKEVGKVAAGFVAALGGQLSRPLEEREVTD